MIKILIGGFHGPEIQQWVRTLRSENGGYVVNSTSPDLAGFVQFFKAQGYDKKLFLTPNSVQLTIFNLFCQWNKLTIHTKGPEFDSTHLRFTEFAEQVKNKERKAESVSLIKLMENAGLTDSFLLQSIMSHALNARDPFHFLVEIDGLQFLKEKNIWPGKFHTSGLDLFNAGFYINQHADVKKRYSIQNAKSHYVNNGIYEGRIANEKDQANLIRFKSKGIEKWSDINVDDLNMNAVHGFYLRNYLPETNELFTRCNSILSQLSGDRDWVRWYLFQWFKLVRSGIMESNDYLTVSTFDFSEAKLKRINAYLQPAKPLSEFPESHFGLAQVPKNDFWLSSIDRKMFHLFFGIQSKKKKNSIKRVIGRFFFENTEYSDYLSGLYFDQNEVVIRSTQLLEKKPQDRIEGLRKLPDLSGNRHINLRLARELEVLVISGGKTASTSLWASFNATVPAWHLHGNYNFRSLYPVLTTLNLHVRDFISYINTTGNRKPLIVSVYREPVSRVVSSFFENLEKHLGISKQEMSKVKVEQLFEPFYEKILILETQHPFLDVANFGDVDVFEDAFDQEKGYKMYSSPSVDVLLLRFDKVAEFQGFIRKNTRFTTFELVSANRTSEKPLKRLYSEFKSKLRIPKHLLELLFDLEKSNLEFFYSPTQLEEIKQKWNELTFETDEEVTQELVSFDWRTYMEKKKLAGRLPADVEYYVKRHFILDLIRLKNR